MAPIWRRLETIFQERYPSLFASLNPPATVDQLDAFEKTTRLNLPTDVRDSYLLHDGCTGVGGYGEGDGPLLFCGYRWATLSEARERWQEYYDVDPYDELDDSAYSYTEAELPDCWAADKVRPWNMVFSPRWFPIGRRGNDSHGGWFIDLLPGPKGHHGQLIEKLTGATSLVVTSSFADYLVALADSLERGEIEHLKGDNDWSTSMWRYKASGKGFLSPEFG